jgi:hypothetical protein
MVNGIGGYNAYAQPSIQERAAGQRPEAQTKQADSTSTKAEREELFKTLLKPAVQAERADTGASNRTPEADPSQGRGQVLDLSV